jgi:hypothetical protein
VPTKTGDYTHARLWRACKTGGGSQTDFIIDLLGDGKQVFSACSPVKPIDRQKISYLPLSPPVLHALNWFSENMENHIDVLAH